MAETAGGTTPQTGGGEYAEASGDGFTISSNVESAADLEATVEADAEENKPDDDEGDEDEKVSKAASELGKKGGEAAAKAKAKAAKEAKAAEKAEADKAAKAKEAKGETADAEAEKANPRNDARARVEQATRQLSEERRARQQLEDRLARLEAERMRPAQPQPDEQPRQPQRPQYQEDPRDPRPKEDDFDNYADFVEARGAWAARREFSQIQRQQAADEYAKAVLTGMRQKGGEVKQVIDKARELVPDLVERTDSRLWDLQPSWTLPPGHPPNALNCIADGLMSAQEGRPEAFAAMMLHLTEHPEDVQRIAALSSPWLVAQAMARLETKVAPVGSPKPPAAVSRAHPPIRPVQGGTQVPEEGSEDESFDDFVRRENAAEARRRRGGR